MTSRKPHRLKHSRKRSRKRSQKHSQKHSRSLIHPLRHRMTTLTLMRMTERKIVMTVTQIATTTATITATTTVNLTTVITEASGRNGGTIQTFFTKILQPASPESTSTAPCRSPSQRSRCSKKALPPPYHFQSAAAAYLEGSPPSPTQPIMPQF